MARQSIPRSDLYGDLGIDPSADAEAIEAAYQALVDREAETDAKGVRRAAKLRLARDWLTDPERRAAYDAARARSAARAEAAAEAVVREFVDAVPAETTDAPPGSVPWPVQDLERPPTGIRWSSTPHDAGEAASPNRAGRMPFGALVLTGLAAIVLVGTVLVIGNLDLPFLAGGGGSSAAPSRATDAGSAAPSGPSTGSPSAGPTSPPTAAPTVASTQIPTGLEALRQGAWDTIRALQAAADAGDLEAAQALLGETAPGLRKSGLRRVTFPEVAVHEITVQREGELHVALAGDARLTSADGQAWTFDYGDRPLAVYRSPVGEPVHDLWWGESDGEHHLFLQLELATVTRSGVTASLAVTFDPSRPDDPTYFRLAGVAIGFVELDGVNQPVTDTTVLLDGATSLTLDATFDGEGAVAADMLLGLTVSNPRELGSNPRLIDTAFRLDVR